MTALSRPCSREAGLICAGNLEDGLTVGRAWKELLQCSWFEFLNAVHGSWREDDKMCETLYKYYWWGMRQGTVSEWNQDGPKVVFPGSWKHHTPFSSGRNAGRRWCIWVCWGWVASTTSWHADGYTQQGNWKYERDLVWQILDSFSLTRQLSSVVWMLFWRKQ